jgi:hypothetical protein
MHIKHEGNRPFGGHTRRWDGSIEVDPEYEGISKRLRTESITK